SLARTFAAPPEPEAIGVTPDGLEVWIGSNEEGTVSVLRPASERPSPEPALEGFGWPYRILFTPDARLALIPDLRRHELRIVDRASRSELARLEFPDAGPQGIALAGERFALLSLSRRANVALIDLETREVVRTIDVGESPDGIAWTSRTGLARPGPSAVH
ncbi:MAG: YncE family protein, partial [Gemmatimonadota bacterium]